MPAQEIYCTVSSCHYYDVGDKCRASRITVRNNPSTLGRTGMEIGSIGGQGNENQTQGSGQRPQQSNQTLCETFVPKGQGPKPGVERIEG